jgi:type IV pilus assembly protein PilQ
MKKSFLKIFTSFIVVGILVAGCTATGKKKSSKIFKHNTPLIKTDVKEMGKAEIDKMAEMGPTPVEGDVVKLKKRKKLSSVKEKNYLLIPEEYVSLKQNVTFNFQNMDYGETMRLMGEIGNVNILVGEDVAGSVTASLTDVPWDKAFNALLDMKNYAADIDVASNIIRVATPATLTSQESYKSARAQAVKKKVELEDSVEPIISEIFRLYYISPAEAKATITELFTSSGGSGSFMPIQVTEEKTTRSIIVRGKEKDLDVVDKVLREIDVRTKQVLMEVYIVEAESSFEQELGKKLGGAFARQDMRAGGTLGGTSVGAPSGTDSAISDDTSNLGDGKDTLMNLPAAGATSGIGILKKTGSAVLKVELEAMEKKGISKIISNPKIFSLDNQTATIKQGEQIPVAGGDGADTFTDAALVMTVTPSIIGDGNVLLDVKVNNDSPNRQNAGSVGINTMEIATKLLVADGDIVVIGGIKKNTVSDKAGQVPGAANLPIVGKMFKGTSKSDKLTDLLVFIAPRIL